MANLSITLRVRPSLVCFDLQAQQLQSVSRVCERFDFRSSVIGNEKDLFRFVENSKNLAGIVVGDKKVAEKLAKKGRQALVVTEKMTSTELLEGLEKYLRREIPVNLLKLAENVTASMIKNFLNLEMTGWKKNPTDIPCFTHWSICDSVASAIRLKATCEMNMDQLKKSYPVLKDLSESQLADASGEICNQILGSINTALRKLSLSPLISLPVELKANIGLSFNAGRGSSFIRFIDPLDCLSIGILVDIDPSYQVSWENLPTSPIREEVEFF